MTATDLLSAEDQKIYTIQENSAEKLILLARTIENTTGEYSILEEKTSQIIKSLMTEETRLKSIALEPAKTEIFSETTKSLTEALNLVKKIKETAGKIASAENAQDIESLKRNLNGYKSRIEGSAKKLDQLKDRLLNFSKEAENALKLETYTQSEPQRSATI